MGIAQRFYENSPIAYKLFGNSLFDLVRTKSPSFLFSASRHLREEEEELELKLELQVLSTGAADGRFNGRT